MLRTSNPVLKSKSFGGFASHTEAPALAVHQQTMTIRGTVDKTAILLALVVVAGLWPWKLMAVDPAAALSWLWIGLVGGLVTALIIIFKNDWAGPLAPGSSANMGEPWDMYRLGNMNELLRGKMASSSVRSWI